MVPNWTVLAAGVAMLALAGVVVATRGAVPPRRLDPRTRLAVAPWQAFVGLGAVVVGVAGMVGLPTAAGLVAGIAGRVMILTGAAAIYARGSARRRTRV